MAQSGIVRISNKAKIILEEMARKSGEPMSSVLDKAIEEYRRRRFLEDVNLAYAELRSDPKASKELDEEMSALDGTLMDGLDPAESWSGKPKGRKRAGK